MSGLPWPSMHVCTVSKMEVQLHSWEAHPTGEGCHPRSASSPSGSPLSKSSPDARLESPTQGGVCGLLQVGVCLPGTVCSPWNRLVGTLGPGEWQERCGGGEAKGNA